MIRQLKGGKFLRNNAVYLIAAIAVGALDYLYYPILGRIMDPAEFGDLSHCFCKRPLT